MTLLSNRTRICAAVLVSALLVVGAALLAMERRSVYDEDAVDLAHAALAPKVIQLGLPETPDSAGGLIAVDLDGDTRRDFLVTGPGYVAAFAASGVPLWSKDVMSRSPARPNATACPAFMPRVCRRPTSMMTARRRSCS